MIERMGFSAYFLIVWDFVRYAKDNGIAVGPGRGSAGGLDRLLRAAHHRRGPARATTCCSSASSTPSACRCRTSTSTSRCAGRDRVIRYVTEKYGRESVAQIVTFGKMFPRAATRDAARVLGHDYGAGDRLAKLIPDPIMGRPPSSTTA